MNIHVSRILFFIIAMCVVGTSLSFILNTKSAAATENSTLYTFNSPGTLYESASLNLSTSPYWWLLSGGKLIIENGVGKTIQGALSPLDPMRLASKGNSSLDSGAHPQNAFFLLSREPMQNGSFEIDTRRIADNLSLALNRKPYIGESLIARYQDANNYYYAGIRADGAAVIKKKTNGVYQTLSQKQIFPGTYNSETNPDLIPLGVTIGLKLTITNNSSGQPTLSFYTDVSNTGVWKLALSATDDPVKFGATISNAGLVGIQSDNADATFDNFRLAPLAATAITTAETPAPSPSYNSAVLADKPSLYLTMTTPSSRRNRFWWSWRTRLSSPAW